MKYLLCKANRRKVRRVKWCRDDGRFIEGFRILERSKNKNRIEIFFLAFLVLQHQTHSFSSLLWIFRKTNKISSFWNLNFSTIDIRSSSHQSDENSARKPKTNISRNMERKWKFYFNSNYIFRGERKVYFVARDRISLLFIRFPTHLEKLKVPKHRVRSLDVRSSGCSMRVSDFGEFSVW